MNLIKLEVKNPINESAQNFHCREGSSDQKGVREVFHDKIYQKKSIGFLVSPGEVWADFGANVGAFSVYAGAICKKIYSYEAELDNYNLTKKNLELNGLSNVELSNLAVVPNSLNGSKVDFYVNKNINHFWMHSCYKAKPDSVKISVPAIGVDEAIKDATCVKMDIEGAEIPILMEDNKIMQLEKLVFEWSFDKERRIAVFAKVLEKLKKNYRTVNHIKLPAAKNWDFYPPCTNVFCVK